MRVYEVTLNERIYTGPVGFGCGGYVAKMIVRARDIPQACSKALAYAKKEGWTPQRVTVVTETEHDAALI